MFMKKKSNEEIAEEIIKNNASKYYLVVNKVFREYALDIFYEKGWELVSVTTAGDSETSYFKKIK